MGNYNVLITNPLGERSLVFTEGVSQDSAKKWLVDHPPAPVGWHYQMRNTDRKKRRMPESILVTGFTKDGDYVGQMHCNHKTNFGWYTVKMAKRDLRAQGAHRFLREKVWSNGHATEGQSETR
jgi:hypothetical protein